MNRTTSIEHWTLVSRAFNSIGLRCVVAVTLFFILQANSVAQQKTAAPEITRENLEKLDHTVEEFIEKDLAVGAELLVIQDGKTLLHESYGYSDKEDEEKWANDTVCNIRSMTKSITSAAAQILIDQGKLELDVPVAQYLEGFDNPKSKSITVRQVLTHRSGLPLTNLLSPFQFESLEEQVAASGENGPIHEPGSKFWYSDAGTDVVGQLVEKVSGEKLDQFVTREILVPLEMTNTFYCFDLEDERWESVASLYLGSPNNWNRFWKPGERLFYPFAWGSQTIYSTASDYARFLAMIMNRGKVGDRQLLSEAAIDRMLEPVSEMKMMGSDASFPTSFRNMRPYYGQMMVSYRDYRAEDPSSVAPLAFGHSGSDGTISWAWPDRNLVVVYFTQSRGGRTPLTIEKSIDQLLVHGGEPVAVEEAPDEYKPLVGTYVANFANFDNEEFTVEYSSGKLILDVPSQMRFELLKPDSEGLYPFAVAPDRVKLLFERNDDGEVIGLKMHQGDNVFDVPRKGREPSKESSDKSDD